MSKPLFSTSSLRSSPLQKAGLLSSTFCHAELQDFCRVAVFETCRRYAACLSEYMTDVSCTGLHLHYVQVYTCTY